jgi:phosphoenolpyruvate phosphomutase
MEAHHPLAAKIVENAGFDGVWASSLTLSSVLGKRDANEATWSQLLEIAVRMASTVHIPVLLDADNALGDFNTMRQITQAASRSGIGGVTVEDKAFPKLNSFLDEQSDLIPKTQFCGMIKAAKDSVVRNNFSVIARTESLVLGHSVNEALDRSLAYIEAGADAILVHSKSNSANEVIQFLRSWSGRSPIIVVPTTYHNGNVEILFEAGATIVVWANHMLRASIFSMLQVAKDIRKNGNITDHSESIIVPMSEIFKILDYQELSNAKRQYLYGIYDK